jgi:tRNA-2-methylthio-N6-dimethylallyladenosine synthase
MLLDNIVKTALPPTAPSNGRSRAAQTALQGNTHRRSSTFAAAEDQLELLDLSRSFAPEEVTGSAYVRITRGCNKFCTYCVVPFTRGAEVHRPPDHIVDECRRLVDAGVIEITLLGQTVNHYHYDHGSAATIDGLQRPQVGAAVKNTGNSFDARGLRSDADAGGPNASRVTTFADLLARIHDEIPQLQRLRFVTSFPRDFGDDILQVMAERPRICRYLHLPVQSGSNRMLELMNRGYSVEQYLELVARIRRYLPDATLAGDLICGFPTETDDDHRATCELLEKVRYKNCFVFKYSPRPGTAAAQRLADDVPDEVKRRRNNELLAIQSRISTAVHADYVGRTVRVFVESVSHKARKAQAALDAADSPRIELGWEPPVTQLTGRTDGDLIVIFDGPESLVGSLTRVRIDQAAPLTLFGRLAEAPAAVTT